MTKKKDPRVSSNFKVGIGVGTVGAIGALLTRSPRLGLVLGSAAGLTGLGATALNVRVSSRERSRKGNELPTAAKVGRFGANQLAIMGGSALATLGLRSTGFGRLLGKVSFSKKPLLKLARAGGQARAHRAIRRGQPVATTSSGVRFVRVRGRIIPIRGK